MKTKPESAGRGRAASSTARVQRFRSKHRRFEYVPGPEALKVIEAWRAVNPGVPLSTILDHVIVAGNAALVARVR